MFNQYSLNVRPLLAPVDILDVNTNVDLIRVFDDLLPPTVINEIKNYNFDCLNWNVRSNGYVGGGTSRYIMKLEDPNRANFILTSKKFILFNGLRNLCPSVEIDATCLDFFIRSENDGSVGQKPHRDCQELGPIWTMLIHLLGDSGPTVFYENSKSEKIVTSVDFKPGRVILFPSLYWHKGCLPNQGTRYILNSIVRLKNFKLTESILDKSPDLKEKYLDKMLK